MNKKIFLLAAGILSIGALSSCGGSNPSTSQTSTSEAAAIKDLKAQLKVDKVYHIGETLSKSDIQVTGTYTDNSTKVLADSDWSCETFGSGTTHVITSDDCTLRVLQLVISSNQKVIQFNVPTFDYKCDATEWNEIVDYYYDGKNGEMSRNFNYEIKYNGTLGRKVSVEDTKALNDTISGSGDHTLIYYKKINKVWCKIQQFESTSDYEIETMSSNPITAPDFASIELYRATQSKDPRVFDPTVNAYVMTETDGGDTTKYTFKLELVGEKIRLNYIKEESNDISIVTTVTEHGKAQVTIPDYINGVEGKKTSDPVTTYKSSSVKLSTSHKYSFFVNFSDLTADLVNPTLCLGDYAKGNSYIPTIWVALNGEGMTSYTLSGGFVNFTKTFKSTDVLAINCFTSLTDDTNDYCFTLAAPVK